MQTVPNNANPPSWSLRLHRHEEQRKRGIPSVTVMVGPKRQSWDLLRGWLRPEGQFAVPTDTIEWEAAVREWVCALATRQDLHRLAIQAAASLLRLPVATVRPRVREPCLERTQLLEELDAGDPTTVLSRLCTGVPLDGLPARDVLRALLHHLDIVPPWLVLQAETPFALMAAAQLAARFVQLSPAFPIAVLAEPSDWRNYLANAPESRGKGWLVEGQFSVPEQVCKIRPPEPTRLGSLRIEGQARNALEALHKTMAQARATPTPEIDARARSAAEAFLYRWLESNPETTGVFELNGRLANPLGRDLEVDLLGRENKIALEIDGYYHFLNPECFKRDRKKDFLLQRQGYIVLRFLAEDLVDELEIIRDRVLDALRWRLDGENP